MPKYVNLGDALHADKIAISARRIDIDKVITRTHRHKGQFGTLRDNAYCVIEQPLRWVLEKKESKRAKRN